LEEEKLRSERAEREKDGLKIDLTNAQLKYEESLDLALTLEKQL
jgi:hypothetical protein